MLNENGKASITRLISDLLNNGKSLSVVDNEVRDIMKSSFVSEGALKESLVRGWEAAVKRSFDDGVLSEEEELRLGDIREHFGLDQSDLDESGSYTSVVKGAVLRDILNGDIPQRLNVEGHMPFNLQKTEKVIWVFQDVDYYEQKTKSHYEGGSRGVSIRVAKGVYYRAGGFKGHRVQTTETVHADTGLMGITNKHIYFSGSAKKFRIRFDKIIEFEPFEDGVGLQRDAQTAKPQTFVTGDGWFTYNLVANLAQL